jgi:tRNA-Thr(GGU) m(6)t(6)A37 methyltransferase TsaA
VIVEPIGRVESSRTQAIDDDWDAVTAKITLDGEQFSPESLAGLGDFSHIEVVFLFDAVDPEDIERGARHPRGNTEWPRVGIFAQRAKMRPNRIGVTVCALLDIDGLTLTVQGLDAMDGTPVLDVKPYMAEFGPRGDVRQPAWSSELMANYWTRPKGAS